MKILSKVKKKDKLALEKSQDFLLPQMKIGSKDKKKEELIISKEKKSYDPIKIE